MSETQVAILLDAVAEAAVLGAWSGVVVAVICLWSPGWGRRVLQLSAVAVGLLAIVAIGFQDGGEPARVVELGTWMSLDGDSPKVVLRYRFDFLPAVAMLAVCFAVLYWSRRIPTSSHDSDHLPPTLYLAILFTAVLQFLLLTELSLRFAFWQLPVFAGLLVAAGESTNGDGRRIFLLRLLGDGCVLTAILGGGVDGKIEVANALLAVGVVVRCLAGIPSLAAGNQFRGDALLPAVLGFLWFESVSQAAFVAGIIVVSVGGWMLLRRSNARITRLAGVARNGVSTFDRHVLGQAIDGLRNVPAHLAETSEPLRDQTERFYAVTLLLATLALLVGIVGWEVLP